MRAGRRDSRRTYILPIPAGNPKGQNNSSYLTHTRSFILFIKIPFCTTILNGTMHWYRYVLV